MIEFKDLINPIPVKEMSITKINEKTLASLCKEMLENHTQAEFVEYATNYLKIENEYMLFVAYDEEQLYCIKKITKLEALLLAEIINTTSGKIDAIKDFIYFADYHNEKTFADSIHQILIINTLNRISYKLAMNEDEIKEDNLIFG